MRWSWLTDLVPQVGPCSSGTYIYSCNHGQREEYDWTENIPGCVAVRGLSCSISPLLLLGWGHCWIVFSSPLVSCILIGTRKSNIAGCSVCGLIWMLVVVIGAVRASVISRMRWWRGSIWGWGGCVSCISGSVAGRFSQCCRVGQWFVHWGVEWQPPCEHIVNVFGL